MHSRILTLCAALCLAGTAGAQVVSEVGSMSVPNSVIDMDALALGATTTAALNAAGTNGGATMASLTMSAKTTSAPGVYNTNVCGQALAAGSGTGGTGLSIINATGSAAFDAMTASIDLGGASTEFGLLIADWVGPAVIDFYSGGALVTSFSSSTYGLCGDKFYQMTGGTFDRVDLDVSTSAGNWVIPQLHIEQVAGGPRLSVTNLVAGSTANISVTGATPGGLVGIAYSLVGPGPSSASAGPCGTVTVDLSNPIEVLPLQTADGSGNVSLSQAVPAGTTGVGVWLHSLDIGSCTLSNSLALVIG